MTDEELNELFAPVLTDEGLETLFTPTDDELEALFKA